MKVSSTNPTLCEEELVKLRVDTSTLEVEIAQCRSRLISGEVGFASATPSVGGKCGHTSAKDMATSPFVHSFHVEIERISNVLCNIHASAESSAMVLLKKADAISQTDGSSKAVSATEITNVKNEAISLQGRMLHLKQVSQQAAQELSRIASMADSQLGTDAVAEADRYFGEEPWVDSGTIVILLSDIFSILRSAEESSNEKEGKKWVAPSSFERVTTKFWVSEENLPQVLLKSVTELPLLVYGRSGLLQQDINNPTKEDLWESLASPISSVYFDSANMDLYKERIKRSEGAKLFRIRWYGNKPKSEDKIFLELKTHHECWVDNKSVKERVVLLEKNVASLLDTSSDTPWSSEHAHELVKTASPNEKEDSIKEAAALLLEIRALICKYKLKPCVRTKYTRCAFQSASNNNLRLTIDRDITVIDETRVVSGGSWCLEDESVVPIDAIVKVPYGVFEVKVGGGEDPLFIHELEESGAIIRANKFSKFLTGAAIHNKKAVNMLPWWAGDPHFAPLFAPPSQSVEAAPSLEGSILLGGHSPDHSSTSDFSSQSSDDQLEAAEEGVSGSRGRRRSSVTFAPMSPLDVSEMSRDSSRAQPQKRLSQRLWSRKSLSTMQEDGTESLTASSSLNRSVSSRLSFRKNSVAKDPKIAPRSPARVEPKSFFANERTFIQWIGAAMAIVLVAQLIFSTAHNEASPEALRAGNWMMGTALCVAIYGMIVYYRRMYLMTSSKPYGYADGVGPAVFTVFTIVGICLILYWSNATFDPPNPTLVEVPGVCVKRHLGGDVSMIEFEPSDIVVDEQRGELLVASNNEIVSLPDGIPRDQEENDVDVKLLYRFPDGGEDLEALEMIGDKIFAVSERNKNSHLILLQREPDDDILAPTIRYEIPTPATEGIAHVSSPNWFSDKKPRLVTAGVTSSKGINSLHMDSFSIPSPTEEDTWIDFKFQDPNIFTGFNPTSLLPTKLNDKIFSGTLSDGKVSAMTYFEGLLYLLFDNAQVIRSFDSLGNLVQETKLPVAVEGYEKQWEGMNLQRKDGELILHLALDSPPQVWSLKLTEKAAVGWELPSCAS